MASKLKHKSIQAKKCKVCSHIQLVEIETMLVVEGLSSRKVAEKISENGWEPVSYVTISEHRRNHVDSKRELLIRYLDDKRKLIEEAQTLEEKGTTLEAENNEIKIRINELRKIDKSIFTSEALVTEVSKVIQEQLSIRVQDKPGHKIQDKRVVDKNGKKLDGEKFYVPLQSSLVTLYKISSEELRRSIETKLKLMGIDSESQKAGSMDSLVDILMAAEDENENMQNKSKKKKKRNGNNG